MYAIKNGIEYGGAPLDEIFGVFHSPELEACGFEEILKSRVPDALEKAMNCNGLIIGKKESDLFCEFASKCGKSGFSENERKLCERYTALAEALDKSLCAEEATRCELYRRLGVLCGLLFALIAV